MKKPVFIAALIFASFISKAQPTPATGILVGVSNLTDCIFTLNEYCWDPSQATGCPATPNGAPTDSWPISTAPISWGAAASNCHSPSVAVYTICLNSGTCSGCSAYFTGDAPGVNSATLVTPLPCTFFDTPPGGMPQCSDCCPSPKTLQITRDPVYFNYVIECK
jgi:hypothetical protein